MAKDFCFSFYPGDYLRDTQCLSEPVQVAYDRIMCEHMRNICISHAQLRFFTKKLSEDETAELLSVLTPIEGGFQIDWVVASITKRKAYSESRSKNRQSKPKKHMSNISKSYEQHMEYEYEIEDEKEIKKEVENEILLLPWNTREFEFAWSEWKDYKKREHRFSYKTVKSEQATLNGLWEDVAGDQALAIDTIKKAIKATWKGLFVEKNKSNGITKYSKDKFTSAINQVFTQS